MMEFNFIVNFSDKSINWLLYIFSRYYIITNIIMIITTTIINIIMQINVQISKFYC